MNFERRNTPQSGGDISFSPKRQTSIVPLLQEEQRRQRANFAMYGEAMNKNAQIAVQDARNQANAQARNDQYQLRQLAEFQRSLGDYNTFLVKRLEEEEKLKKEQEEVDSFWYSLTGGLDNYPGQNQFERDRDQAVTSTAERAGLVSDAMEAESGLPSMAERARVQAGGAALPAMEGRAALMRAQSTYSGWLAAYMSSDAIVSIGGREMSVRDAVNSGQPSLVSAAIAEARFEFIRQNGLYRADRRDFVRYLGTTMISVESSISTSLVQGAIKAQRGENVSLINSGTYEGARSVDLAGIQQLFSQRSQQMFTQNTGLSRREANRATVESMIQAYIDSGNIDALEAMLDIRQVPNQAGTELRYLYGDIIRKGITDAGTKRQQLSNQTIKDINADMYRQLAELGEGATIEERGRIIESTARQLEQQGEFKEARTLRNQYDELTVDGNAERNASRLLEEVRAGNITAEGLNEARLRGDISQETFESLSRELGSVSDNQEIKDPEVKDTTKAYYDRFVFSFEQAMGLKPDERGNYPEALYGESALIGGGEAKIILNAARQDMRRLVNEYLRNNPNLPATERLQAINTLLKTWYQDNVVSPDGKYYVQDVLDARRNKNTENPGIDPEVEKSARQRFQNLLNSPGVLSRPTGADTVPMAGTNRQAKDFTSRETVDDYVRSNFNPIRGDRLYKPDQVKALVESYNRGVIQKTLQQKAEALGMTPLALLNQQLGAYGLEPLDVNTQPLLQQTNYNGAEPNDLRSGAQYFMNQGFSVRAAAYLSGNIQQESSWRGQRRPFDDGGALAGGLVSWRGGRLQAIESYFGRPISEITTLEQLDYMVQEMRNSYPDAYEIFTNPRASERQLRRASYRYWGYGVEGNRYGYAQQIERELGNQSSTYSGGRRVAYRTGNVGPTSTGEHLDVKKVGGGRFDLAVLDPYVEVDDREHGTVTLSRLRVLTNFVGDSWDQHYARGSHGIDVGTHSGTPVFVKNGARVVSSRPTEHGELTVIQLPNGQKYSFLHGYSA